MPDKAVQGAGIGAWVQNWVLVNIGKMGRVGGVLDHPVFRGNDQCSVLSVKWSI